MGGLGTFFFHTLEGSKPLKIRIQDMKEVNGYVLWYFLLYLHNVDALHFKEKSKIITTKKKINQAISANTIIDLFSKYNE